MKFDVELLTSEDVKEELFIFGDSVRDTIAKVKELKPGCKIKNVMLIPQYPDSVVIFSHGEQYEVHKSALYKSKEKKH